MLTNLELIYINLDDYFKRCSIQNVKKIIVIKIPNMIIR